VSLIAELAVKGCERLTSRNGCLGPSPEPIEEQCYPCRARAELGLPDEAPRYCENCHARLVSADGSGGIWTGIDEQGSHHCPAPLHKPHLFYDEFTRKKAPA